MIELTNEDIELIEEINKKFHPLVDKYGKEKLRWAAEWLFSPSNKKIMRLIDKKGWEKDIPFPMDSHFPRNHRIPIYPDICSMFTLDSIQDLPKIFDRIDVTFEMSDTEYEEKECGCKTIVYVYREV